jgi:hypothetical protein
MVSSKADAEGANSHSYSTKEEAQVKAKEMGCDGHHVHETDDGPVYMPCSTHEAFQKVLKHEKNDAIAPLKTEGMILADIDEAAQISAEDIDAALNQWKEEAPERFKDILEAEDVEPTE